jgi:hypothetical protein
MKTKLREDNLNKYLKDRKARTEENSYRGRLKAALEGINKQTNKE